MKNFFRRTICFLLLIALSVSFAGCADIMLAIFGPQLQEISVKTLPAKVDYLVGEELNLSGGDLTLSYSDSSTKTISMISQGVFSEGYDKYSQGVQTIELTYQFKKTEFEVTVEAASQPSPDEDDDPVPDDDIGDGGTVGEYEWGSFTPLEGSCQTGIISPHLIAESEKDENPIRYIDSVQATKDMTAYPVDTPEQIRKALDDMVDAVVEGKRPIVPDDGENPITQVWTTAIDILNRFIKNDFSEYEKCHTIYDYLVYFVDYDHVLLDEFLDNNGVVDGANPAFNISGVFLYNLAVCDGISKAYSLLCAIEGIKVVRVTGKADNVAHAWNKVYIQAPNTEKKEWYFIDATWGCLATPRINWISKDRYEYVYDNEGNQLYDSFLSHKFFMLTDAAAVDHIEDTRDVYPPATTVWNYYQFSGQLIQSQQQLNSYAVAAAQRGEAGIEVVVANFFLDINSLVQALYSSQGMTSINYLPVGNLYIFIFE